jgi:hypothetical protein
MTKQNPSARLVALRLSSLAFEWTCKLYDTDLIHRCPNGTETIDGDYSRKQIAEALAQQGLPKAASVIYGDKTKADSLADFESRCQIVSGIILEGMLDDEDVALVAITYPDYQP